MRFSHVWSGGGHVIFFNGVNSIKPPHWWPNLPKTTTFGLRDKKPPHLSWFFAEHPNDEFAAN
jgi:hypothetical protein